MRSINSGRLAATVSLFALAATFAPSAALAQDAPPPTPETTEQADPAATTGDAATVEPQVAPEVSQQPNKTIVVTGSRIRRSEFTSPDPITVINPELGAREGKIETVDLINSSPIAAGSVQITSAISTNFVTNGGEGAQTVSLRGLGAERTLVLLNGRRAGPAGVRGAVASFDLNVLPASIVNSIEILKTGASSIYGSDAVAGVVNILTKRSTDGVELRGFTTVPTESGGEAYNVSATYGKEFSRGHVLVSADFFRRNHIQRRDRDFLDCSEEFLKFETGERADLRDPDGSFSCAGILHNSILTNFDFTGPLNFDTGFFDPGMLDPTFGNQLFVSRFGGADDLNGICVPLNGLVPTPGFLSDAPVVAPADFFGCNFDGPSTGALQEYSERQRESDASSKLTRKTLYLDASFEVNDHIELFTELLYNNRKTHTDGVLQMNVIQFSGGADAFALPQFFCDPTFDFNCVPTDAGDPFNTEFQGRFLLRPLIEYSADSGTDIDYYRGVLGGRGDFGSFLPNFGWDVYAQYSKSDGKYFQDYAREDSVFTQAFRTRSCVGLETPVVGLPCIDIDFTDPRVLAGNFNEEEREFLFDRDVGRTKFTQMSGEATISGDLIDLPAGSLGIALGATIRKDKIKDTPGEGSLLQNRHALFSSGVTAGEAVTRELFGELQIPVVRDQPFFQRLNLSAAGRITRVKAERRDGVDDKFGDETWKLGADWQVNDWLRFRGSWGTSFRAPALFELFLENQTGFQSQADIDLCANRERGLELGTITPEIDANCTALGIDDFAPATGSAEIISRGGIGTLEPETSTAKTFSVVLTPTFSFLPDTRVSLAVDYFDIEVRDEITQLGGFNIVLGCLQSDDVLNEPLCDLITRVPAGEPDEFNIVEIEDPYINISEQRNRGIDVTGQITHDLGNLGRLTFLAQMTWQLEDKVDVFGNNTGDVDLNGEVGDPRWIGDFNLTWAKGPWTVTYGLDVIGSADNKEDLLDDQASAVGDDGCRTSLFRPGPGITPEEAAAGARVPFCPDVSVDAVAYHSLSVTREIGERFQFTLGMANIFDKKPPRVSTVFNGGIAVFGQTPVFGSQYDWLGRRFFANVRANF
ncbi:MAG TPA: TonB-dependent receptor [Sphingomicrobium sp.]|nr:TonB-dependent receptor [Sphingomicrobium sp.]